MKKNILKNMEWTILICTILLSAIGIVALYSATKNAEYDELKKQIMWLGISIPVLITIIIVDYETFAKVSPFFYGFTLVLLVLVMFTTPINGATSWFEIGPVTFQPAEFAKIFVIITISDVIVKIQNKSKCVCSNRIC